MEISASPIAQQDPVSKSTAGREISTRGLIGDAMGQFSLNITSGLLGLITFYYTDIVGVSAAIVGTILLITKVLDAVADIGMGVLVDRTKSKHGQARPWLLWMAIPTVVSCFLLFSVPDISPTGKIMYAIITNLFFYLAVYTPTSIPYNSLMALTTKSPYERSLIGIFRSGFGYLAGMIVAIGFLPIVNGMGGSRTEWTILATILGAVAAAGVFISFVSTKEKYNTTQLSEDGSNRENIPVIKGLKLLFSNRYWVIMLCITAMANILFAIAGTSGMYFAKYIWNDVNLVSIMGAIGLIPVIIVFLASAPFIKRYGKRNTAIVGIVIGIVGALLRLIDPADITLGLIGSMLQSFGMIPLMVVGGALTTDTIDYGEWKFGERIVGLNASATSFGGKIGTGLGAAMIGWLLAFGGYQESSATQGLMAKQMIIALNIYIPIFVSAIILFLLMQFTLDKQFPTIMAELEQRRRKNH